MLLVVTWAFGSKICRDNTARTKGDGIARLTTKTVLSGEHGWPETQAKDKCKYGLSSNRTPSIRVQSVTVFGAID